MKMNFETIKLRGEKRFRCDCGRRCRRWLTLFQTINPFNRAPDGRPKSDLRILTELRLELRAWRAAKEACRHGPVRKNP